MAQYYLFKDNERKGPFAIENLLENGLTPDVLVWTTGMAKWAKASTIPEVAALFAQPVPPAEQPTIPMPSVPPAAPPPSAAQPAAAQPAQPAFPQAAVQRQPFGVGPQAGNQNIFKIILYIMLGFSILSSVIVFFSAFTYFGKWLNSPLLGICQMIYSLAAIGICVFSILKMVKNEKFGFLTIGYFALTMVLSVISIILVRGFGIWTIPAGLVGLAIAVLASIPMDKAGDPESYKALLSEATPIDYGLLGANALFMLIYDIIMFF